MSTGAAVAALILTINPNLTQQQVFNILTSSTDRGTHYTYTNGRSNEFGYGRLNAFSAVSQALSTICLTSGPPIVCSSPNSTYTLSNRPSGTSVSWNKSTNLQYVSGQGTDNYSVRASSVSGYGWVQPTIIFGTDSVRLPQYYVWVGTPVVSVTGPYEGCTNTQYTFQAHTVNPSQTYPFSYSWEIYPNDGYISTYTGGNYAAYAYITFYNEYSVSGYQVKARAQNSCGTGIYGQTNIWIHNCYYFMLSPNPASESVTISVINKTGEERVDINTVYSIRIIDFYGRLYYTGTKAGSSFSVPLDNLKDGNYFINIDNGKKTESLPLMVKH